MQINYAISKEVQFDGYGYEVTGLLIMNFGKSPENIAVSWIVNEGTYYRDGTQTIIARVRHTLSLNRFPQASQQYS